MAEIVNLVNVPRWEPNTSYDRFRINEDVPDKFSTINDNVGALCEIINNICSDLGKLKTALGENTGSIQEIDGIISELQNKKEEVKTKNRELISICDQLCQVIAENKVSQRETAEGIRERLAGIMIYDN